MRPIEISLSGYRSYREPVTVDFSEGNLICITGLNGSGKTSIIEGIAFALFGFTRGSDLDGVVALGADKAEVALTFDHDGGRYRVTRTRIRGKRTTALLEREVDGEFTPEAASGVRGVDDAIGRLIRISEDTFVSLVLILAGDIGKFASASPARRKEILSEILNLDVYPPMAREARDEARSARQRHDELQRRVAEIDDALAGEAPVRAEADEVESRMGSIGGDLEAARERAAATLAAASETDATARRLQSVREQIAAATTAAERRRAEIEAAAARLRAVVAEATRSRDEARNLVDAISADELRLVGARELLTAATSEAEEATRLLQEITASGATIRAKVDSEQAEADRLATTKVDAEERLRGLEREGASCFTCGQALAPDLHQQLIESTKRDIETLAGSIEGALRRKADAAQEREVLLASHTEAKAAAERAGAEKERAASEVIRLETRIATKPEATSALERAESALRAAEEEVASAPAVGSDGSDDLIVGLQQEERTLAEQLEAAKQLAAERDTAAAAVKSLEAEQAGLVQRVGALRERCLAFDAQHEQREQLLLDAKAAAADAEEWALCARGFGQDGVPNMIFAGQTEIIEQDISEIIADLTGGAYRVELTTDKTSKSSGETVEALELTIVKPSGSLPYTEMSAGEQVRIDMAVRSALTRLLVRRSNAPIEMLAIDECGERLDEAGTVGELAALRGMSEEFPLIIAITQRPEVAAAFSMRYEVEKDSDGTSVVAMVSA